MVKEDKPFKVTRQRNVWVVDGPRIKIEGVFMTSFEAVNAVKSVKPEAKIVVVR